MIDVKVNLIPLNLRQTSFGGYILIQIKDKISRSSNSDSIGAFSLRTQIETQQSQKLEHLTVSFDGDTNLVDLSSLCCSPFMASLFSRLGHSSYERLTSCQGVNSFSQELEDLLSRITILDRNLYLTNNLSVNKDNISHTSSSILEYSETILQIEQLGWDKVNNVDGFPVYLDLGIQIEQWEDTSRSTNSVKDSSNFYVENITSSKEKFFLKSKIPFYFRVIFGSGNPGSIQSVEANLPYTFNIIKGDTLSNIYERMAHLIKKFKTVWEILDDIDIHSYVIEPEGVPSRSDMKRRLRIDTDVSIMFEIDPYFPFAVLNLSFIGPTESVNVYEKRYVDNISLWDTEKMPRFNIERILNLQELPLKPLEGAAPTDGDCCICYAYLLPVESESKQHENVKDLGQCHIKELHSFQESRTPDVKCPEKRCCRSFHKRCLQEWFSSLHKHPILGNITGECPYCQSDITIKI